MNYNFSKLELFFNNNYSPHIIVVISIKTSTFPLQQQHLVLSNSHEFSDLQCDF